MSVATLEKTPVFDPDAEPAPDLSPMPVVTSEHPVQLGLPAESYEQTALEVPGTQETPAVDNRNRVLARLGRAISGMGSRLEEGTASRRTFSQTETAESLREAGRTAAAIGSAAIERTGNGLRRTGRIGKLAGRVGLIGVGLTVAAPFAVTGAAGYGIVKAGEKAYRRGGSEIKEARAGYHNRRVAAHARKEKRHEDRALESEGKATTAQEKRDLQRRAVYRKAEGKLRKLEGKTSARAEKEK